MKCLCGKGMDCMGEGQFDSRIKKIDRHYFCQRCKSHWKNRRWWSRKQWHHSQNQDIEEHDQPGSTLELWRTT